MVFSHSILSLLEGTGNHAEESFINIFASRCGSFEVARDSKLSAYLCNVLLSDGAMLSVIQFGADQHDVILCLFRAIFLEYMDILFDGV